MIPDLGFMQAYNFLQHPAHPVTDDGVADLFTSRNAEPKTLDIGLGRIINNELTVGERLSVPIHPAEVRPVS